MNSLIDVDFQVWSGIAPSLIMTQQLHKRFSNEQIKSILAKYAQGEFSVKDAIAYLGIGRTRFYQLVQSYQADSGFIPKNLPSRINLGRTESYAAADSWITIISWPEDRINRSTFLASRRVCRISASQEPRPVDCSLLIFKWHCLFRILTNSGFSIRIGRVISRIGNRVLISFFTKKFYN